MVPRTVVLGTFWATVTALVRQPEQEPGLCEYSMGHTLILAYLDVG